MVRTTAKEFSIGFFALLAMICIATPVRAVVPQVFFGGNGGDEAKQYREQLRYEMKEMKSQFEQRLATRIDDINRTCELSPEQLIKLQVASRGAQEKAMVKLEKQAKDLYQQFGLGQADDLDDEKQDNKDEAEQGDTGGSGDKEELDDDPQPQSMFGSQMFFVSQLRSMGQEFPKPEKEKIWINAVEKTLTETQTEKYGKAVAARNEMNRKAAVDAFVAQADVLLLMNADQRRRLTVEIDKDFGEALQKDLEKDPDDQNGMIFLELSTGRGVSKGIREILSPAQLSVWQDRFAGKLMSMKAEQNRGNGQQQGVFNWFFGN